MDGHIWQRCPNLQKVARHASEIHTNHHHAVPRSLLHARASCHHPVHALAPFFSYNKNSILIWFGLSVKTQPFFSLLKTMPVDEQNACQDRQTSAGPQTCRPALTTQPDGRCTAPSLRVRGCRLKYCCYDNTLFNLELFRMISAWTYILYSYLSRWLCFWIMSSKAGALSAPYFRSVYVFLLVSFLHVRIK